MALGKRKPKQASLWADARHRQAHPAHPFYRRLNEILERAQFDRYVERLCRKYYAPTLGRPSIAPGVYFRCFLVGYFEGIGSERGIAYRIADSLSLREFLGLSREEPMPDHSRRSKTRRRLSLGTHKAVFRWVLKLLVREGLLSGKNLGVDATTLEANAALKAIVRRDHGASYDEYVAQRMANEGLEEPTAAQRQRWDRRRKKRLSNREWVNPHDPEARITKLKDGRAHLAYQAEHAVDLDTGGLRRVHLRGKDNIAKRLLIHAAAFHLSLILRQLLGVGTARQAADLLAALCFCILRLIDTANRGPLVVGTPCPTARTAHPRRCHHQSPRRHDLALSTG
jgi:transposase